MFMCHQVSHCRWLAFLLILFCLSCTEEGSQTPVPIVTTEPTYSTEGETAKLTAQIEQAEPPNHPQRPSCIYAIPEQLYRAYDRKFAEWASQKIVDGDFAALENRLSYGHEIRVLAGRPGTFLVTIPRLECQLSSHATPGASLYVMDRLGGQWQITDFIGMPYPRFAERVRWDGTQWIMLANETSIYWGGTSEQFFVWHISETASGWHGEKYEFVGSPIFHRALDEWRFARFEGDTIIGYVGHSECTDVEEANPTARRAQQFKFDGQQYKPIATGFATDQQFMVCRESLH